LNSYSWSDQETVGNILTVKIEAKRGDAHGKGCQKRLAQKVVESYAKIEGECASRGR
jgi:hypothetical protein